MGLYGRMLAQHTQNLSIVRKTKHIGFRVVVEWPFHPSQVSDFVSYVVKWKRSSLAAAVIPWVGVLSLISCMVLDMLAGL